MHATWFLFGELDGIIHIGSYLGECFATFGMIVKLLDIAVGLGLNEDEGCNKMYRQFFQNIFKSLVFLIN